MLLIRMQADSSRSLRMQQWRAVKQERYAR